LSEPVHVYQVRGEIGAHRLQSAPTRSSSDTRKRPASVAHAVFTAVATVKFPSSVRYALGTMSYALNLAERLGRAAPGRVRYRFSRTIWPKLYRFSQLHTLAIWQLN
jgi:hypothetical protein